MNTTYITAAAAAAAATNSLTVIIATAVGWEEERGNGKRQANHVIALGPSSGCPSLLIFF